ncbi:MAG: hypothetical protein RBS43_08435 [Candidatus Cloacimonas sp.]|jgi:DNA mismatch repair ATPase MutS|nr:hypothetical protein [Candidatus Cloacimonas sp.]
MPKMIRENLSLNKLYNLIEAKGELCSAVKRHKLAKSPQNIEALRTEYTHIQRLKDLFQMDKITAAKLDNLFSHIQDLAVNHLLNAAELELHEFFELKNFLWHYGQLRDVLCDSGLGSMHSLPDLGNLFCLLDPEGNNLPTFRISPLYSADLRDTLDKLQKLSLNLKQTREIDLKQARAELELPTLKEAFVISRNRQDMLSKVLRCKYFVLSSENMANYSFQLADSPLALSLKSDLQVVSEAIQDIESEIKDMLRQKVQACAKELKEAWHSTSELAWDYTLAQFAMKYSCCIPELLDFAEEEKFPGIQLEGAINLPLKLFLEDIQRAYQPLDISLDNAANLITGPNMGGKSTALITIGQACALAARGIPIPAKSARVPIYAEIYYNHDTGENSETLSSFGREVVSITLALRRGGRKLILLDEFAKGTNPAEGEAICMAVIKHLQTTPHTLISATHFTAPAKLKGIAHFTIKGIDAEGFARLESLPDTSLEARLKLLSAEMDYSLVSLPDGEIPPQCALRIAAILGLPTQIMEQI